MKDEAHDEKKQEKGESVDALEDLVNSKVKSHSSTTTSTDERARLERDDDNDMVTGRGVARGVDKPEPSIVRHHRDEASNKKDSLRHAHGATKPGAVAVPAVPPSSQNRVALGTFEARAPDAPEPSTVTHPVASCTQDHGTPPVAGCEHPNPPASSASQPYFEAAFGGEGGEKKKNAQDEQERPQLYPEATPGAVWEGGREYRMNVSQYDSTNISVPQGGGTDAGSATPHIVATLVDEEDGSPEMEFSSNVPVAVAKKDSFLSLLRYDRRTKMIAALVLVALIGLGVGLGVALSKSNDDGSSTIVQVGAYEQAGSNIDGPDKFFELGSGESSKFGSSVGFSGDGMILAVGAPEFEGKEEDDKLGLVQMFEEVDGDWALMEPIGIVGTQAGDLMGHAVGVSLDGQTVAVAAPGFDNDKGMVQAYSLDPATRVWQPLGPPLLGQFNGQELGWSLGISSNGRRIVVATRSTPEVAKVFDYDGQEWVQVGDDLEGLFGVVTPVSLSHDGTTVACGSLSKSENDFVGGIRVYKETDGTSDEKWTMRGTDILQRGAAGLYETGWTASLSGDGDTVAIGTSVENAQGLEEYDLKVLIFHFDDTKNDWEQLGLTQHDKTGTHLIAYTVALSADAQFLAIGDPGGFAMGINSGHTHVLRWQDGEWFHITRELEGTDAADLFGQALGMSADGSRVCVGSPQSRATGREVGRVQIFELMDED